MTTGSAGVPRFFVDPINTVCDIVATIEPKLQREHITAAVETVAGNRASQRRLARALHENPALLTSGIAEGPPMVDGLIRFLRDCGATQLVQPLCGSCGKPQRQMSKYNSGGVRICVTCDNRAVGRFDPQPCANCGKVLTPRTRDRNGGPRCEWCPPEPDVDHVEVICELVTAVRPIDDRAALKKLINECVRQPARRRQLAWDLQDNPTLLTGQAISGSPTVRRLILALRKHGIDVTAPCCPFCGHTRRLESLRDGQPCCHSCYQDTRRTSCTRCDRELPIAARTVDGDPLCWACTQRAEFNHEICAVCGDFKSIGTRRGGRPTCFDCRTMPLALCSTCEMTRPCYFPDSATPRCLNCTRLAKAIPCSKCGGIRPVSTRDETGEPLCSNCSRRREHCGRCGRFLPVTARIGAEPCCWNCVKKEPALFRFCTECGVFGRMRQAGRCDGCAANHKLIGMLAGSSGGVPRHLKPVHEALTASPGHSLFTWLTGTNATTLLSQLAAAPGPVSHNTLDDLSPSRGARWLRHALVTHGVLPVRDEHLHALERWLHTKLPEVADSNERRLLTGYVTWSHLRRLRSARKPTSPGQSASIRDEVKSIVKLLQWLHGRGVELSDCTQPDVDQWCLQGGRMPLRARGFVAWCVQRRYLPPVAIPAPQVRQDRHLLDDDHRWAVARNLLQSDTVAVVDRVAGLLVLLYGQSTSRIVRLTVHDVIDTSVLVQLRLGAEPVALPSPLDDLLRQLVIRRRGKAAVGHSDAHDWLFPGGDPGQPLHPLALSRRLRDAGVSVRDGRNTALMHMASTLPAKVLSDLLGISATSAALWNSFAGSGNAEYAAALARRQTTEA